MDAITLQISLVERGGYFFVALNQPPHVVLIPVANRAAGERLQAGLRQLLAQREGEVTRVLEPHEQ